MNPVLFNLAEQYFLQKLASGNFPFARQSQTASLLRMIAGILAVTATGFLIVAMYYWLGAHYKPDAAALIAAAAIFAVSLLAAGIAGLIVMERRSRMRAMKEEVKKNLKAVFETLDEEIGQPVRDHPAGSMALAALAGFTLADRVI